jgi:hypothetical protein
MDDRNDRARKSAARAALLVDHPGEFAALDQAGREAMWRHKRLGVPVALWQDGQVVEIPAEEIPEEWCSRPARLAFPW